jgi:hypothetical protein
MSEVLVGVKKHRLSWDELTKGWQSLTSIVRTVLIYLWTICVFCAMIHQIIFFKGVSSVFQHYNLGVGKKSCFDQTFWQLLVLCVIGWIDKKLTKFGKSNARTLSYQFDDMSCVFCAMIHQIIFSKGVSRVFQNYNLGVGKKSSLLLSILAVLSTLSMRLIQLFPSKYLRLVIVVLRNTGYRKNVKE